MPDPIRILYVDDSRFDRELVRDALEQENGGFRVTEAGSQHEFETQIGQNNFDVILTDFNILGFDGLQVLDILQTRAPHLPVVLVTGTGSEEIAVEAMKRGAADYVIKTPQHIRRLPYTIHAVLHDRDRQLAQEETLEALRASEERFRFLIEGSIQGVIIVRSDLRPLFVNQAYADIFGYASPADILAMETNLPLFAPHEHARLLHYANNRPRGEHVPNHYEVEGRRRDGTPIWLDCKAMLVSWNGEPATQGTVFDITAQKRAQEALQESESRFRTVFEAGPLGMAFVATDGWFIAVNAMLCRMLGYSEAELTSRTVLDVTHPHDVPSSLERIARLKSGVVSRLEFEKRYLKKNGDIFWGHITATPLLDAQGNSSYHIAMIQDISERKQLEQDILDLSSQEQQRLGQDLHDGLGQFLNGIAYLAKSLETRLKRQSRPEAGDAAHLVELVRQAGDQTRQLVHQLYPTELETLGLLETLQDMAQRIQTTYDISCAVVEDITVPLPDSGVSLHLYRIAQEALHNAVRHGTPQHVTIRLVSQPDRVVLSIDDDGTGLPPEASRSPGTGLRSMRYRAGMLGATLDVYRLPQGGTRVRCQIPI